MNSKPKANDQRLKCTPALKGEDVDESDDRFNAVENLAGIKKMSRRKSDESSGKKLRRKRSARRLQRFKSDGNMNLTASLPSASLPPDVTTDRRDALLRFNSLTLDDKIALKLAGKMKADDSVSSNSSVDSDS